ncbi:MAG: RNA polymerase Rpb4 family protein [Methanobrevibacter sp.]|uniref:RNA polymerase Rpb4 family protein n=1 Tax=Methanobrevibacter sp. TaxID=66852 RepID=UPI0026DF4851|nr:RNA polymerase Rpb4 family protein [Methanobrevibacter sp.]MDO5848599.1 RNA polymerase Rpb4 family protein [Methanobrevibacter sp.]
MIGKKIIATEPISSVKVKEVLDEYAEGNELNYEQNITLNHLSRLPHFSLEDSEKIIEELEAMDIKNKVAVRIVDLIPIDLSDLRLIFAKEVKQPSKEEMEKILEILEKYDIEE